MANAPVTIETRVTWRIQANYQPAIVTRMDANLREGGGWEQNSHKGNVHYLDPLIVSGSKGRV